MREGTSGERRNRNCVGTKMLSWNLLQCKMAGPLNKLTRWTLFTCLIFLSYCCFMTLHFRLTPVNKCCTINPLGNYNLLLCNLKSHCDVEAVVFLVIFAVLLPTLNSASLISRNKSCFTLKLCGAFLNF